MELYVNNIWIERYGKCYIAEAEGDGREPQVSIEPIESLRLDLRFRVPLGDGVHELRF
jgi:hypothetical protein